LIKSGPIEMKNGECDRKGCCKDIELVGVQHVNRMGSLRNVVGAEHLNE
jgi:hypothetical protein